MKSIVVNITCPFCGRMTHKKSETLIISDLETNHRLELLKGNYFQTTCSNCKSPITYMHPLLYVDKKHQFLLLMKSKADVSEIDQQLYEDHKHYHKRFITRPQDIIEKIRIFEDQLDDRVIELIKFKLMIHYQKLQQSIHSIVYYDMDSTSETIWFQMNKDQLIAVENNTYATFARHLKKDDDLFTLIDKQWAVHMMNT